MKALIDAFLGRGRSLADDQDMLLLAQAMDGLRAYSVLLSGDTGMWGIDEVLASFQLPARDLERVREQYLEQAPLLDNFSAMATGVGRDDDGLYMAVALVYDSVRTAERDVPRLERRVEDGLSLRANRPWLDYFSAVEVWSEGRLVLAKLDSLVKTRFEEVPAL